MRKIPTLFVRDPDTLRKYVSNVVMPSCEWVMRGEGIATRKYDGTCCMVRDGQLFKRREIKPAVELELVRKDEPNVVWYEVDHQPFELVAVDTVPGQPVKWIGWVPVGNGPEDQWHREAWDRHLQLCRMLRMEPMAGTYELIGPKVQGNPEGRSYHELVRHEAAERLDDVPRDFDGLRSYLTYPAFHWEGIVWHHPDGRMAKLKKRDFPK